MAEEFPILEVPKESAERIEQLGSKRKFWFRREDGTAWLFKFARSNTGEHWAEKIAAEISQILEIPHARIELATFSGERGSVSPSFVPAGSALIHGNEILAGHVVGYDPAKRFGQQDHTFPNIVKAFYGVFEEGPQRDEALSALAGYLILDAIICNMDRHHENWAFLRQRASSASPAYAVAPTFDHASSLGRELLDERRSTLLRNRQVAAYIRKGQGAIYWHKTDEKPMSPLALAVRAATIHRSYFVPWIERVKRIDPAELDLLLSRVPDTWMSKIAREFTLNMLLCTIDQLKQTTP